MTEQKVVYQVNEFICGNPGARGGILKDGKDSRDILSENGVCVEACPDGAILFGYFLGKVWVSPVIDPELCNGCGKCLLACRYTNIITAKTL